MDSREYLHDIKFAIKIIYVYMKTIFNIPSANYNLNWQERNYFGKSRMGSNYWKPIFYNISLNLLNVRV